MSAVQETEPDPAEVWPCCEHTAREHGTEGCVVGWGDPDRTTCYCQHRWPDQAIACPERTSDRAHCLCWADGKRSCCGCTEPVGATT